MNANLSDDASYQPYPQSSNTGFWFFMLLMLIGGGLLIWFVVRPLVDGTAGSGSTLSTLQLEPLTGGSSEVSLAELRGKVALVNFWGTWCPPCRKEFPDIEALADRYRHHDDVLILPVSCSGGMGENMDQLRSTTQAFLNQQESDLPNYADPGQKTRMAVRDAVGFRGYPTTVLLDREGKIRQHWTGATSAKVMNAAIEDLLAETPTEVAN